LIDLHRRRADQLSFRIGDAKVQQSPPRATTTGYHRESSMRSLTDILISWTPMLLLIGVWIFFMRRMGNTRQVRDEWMATMKTCTVDQLVEMRRQNAALERIAAALEGRQSGGPSDQT